MSLHASAIADTGIVDWLPVIAAAIIAGGALVGIPWAHRFQARREHARWLADRRLDAYATLATATFSLGHMTATRGEIVANFEPTPAWGSVYKHVQDLWERYNDEAAAALNHALLVSDRALYTRIVELNEVMRSMVDASLRAGAQVDAQGKVVRPGDAAALHELEDLTDKLVEVRNQFLQDAWGLIHGRKTGWIIAARRRLERRGDPAVAVAPDGGENPPGGSNKPT